MIPASTNWPLATNWKERLDQLIRTGTDGNPELGRFGMANALAITAAVSGRGPDDTDADPEAGVRMVVNIASVHIPAFCEASRRNEARPYKNGYDLGKYRIGEALPGERLKVREIVDSALPLDGSGTAADVYFGAVELNGAGIRFYGDACLVLGRSSLDGDTVVLDRNSYDLLRSPIREAVESEPEAGRDRARKNEAWKMRGLWDADVGSMAAVKTLPLLGWRVRRYTTGQISEAVRDDEDYLEVLKIGSFGARDLQEARFAAADAAHDALTGDRLRSRPAPRLESLMWRARRRRAEEELRRERVRVGIVTTSGRTKD